MTDNLEGCNLLMWNDHNIMACEQIGDVGGVEVICQVH